MILGEYFSVCKNIKSSAKSVVKNSLASQIFTIQEVDSDLKNIDIALIGIAECRNSEIILSEEDVNKIREELYKLHHVDNGLKVIDLGNFRLGKTVKDTYVGLEEVCRELISKNVTPVIFGGTQDLTVALYRAANKGNKTIRLTNIDSKIDYSKDQDSLFTSSNFLSEILTGEKNIYYSNIATQKYLNDPENITFLKDNNFENYRLGQIRNNTKGVEPILRDTHVLSFDISSMKYFESPAQKDPSPNGLNNDEICQIARYAGLSPSIKAFGLFNYYGNIDEKNISAKSIAQTIWHFIEGNFDRRKVLSNYNQDLKKYIISIESSDNHIEFHNNPNTGHWWFLVPNSVNNKTEVFACSENDYKTAMNNRIPERWWILFQKLNF